MHNAAGFIFCPNFLDKAWFVSNNAASMSAEFAASFPNKIQTPKIITRGEAIESLAVNKVMRQVLDAVRLGKNILLRTPTSSGKTSIINALMADGIAHSEHKVLVIQPTQALTKNYASTHEALSPLKKVVPWSTNGEGYLPEEINLENEIATVKFLVKLKPDGTPELDNSGDSRTLPFKDGMRIPEGWKLEEYELEVNPAENLNIYEAKQEFDSNNNLVGKTATNQIIPTKKLRQLGFAYTVAHHNRSSSNLKRDEYGKIENTAVAMTDGKGANMVLSDPLLSEFNIIVFDELDKSTLYQNQLLTHVKWLQDNNIRQNAGLQPLQIIVTSATVSQEFISEYLNTETITLEDSTRVNKPNVIPVPKTDLVFSNVDGLNWVESSAKYLEKVISSGEAKYGQAISVFLPRIAEVEELVEKIPLKIKVANGKELVVFPFHSQVDAQYLEYVRTYKARPNEIVVYVATEAMASGITPATVITTSIIAPAVIRKTYDSVTGVNSIEEETMSRSVAIQMIGRMGRTEKSVSLGKEINAYILGKSLEDLKPTEANGMERGNIDVTILATVASLGKIKVQLTDIGNYKAEAFDINNYPFPINIEGGRVAKIVEKLKMYKALDSDLNITDLGKFLVDLSLPIESGVMVYEAKKKGIAAEALIIANILSAGGENLFKGKIDERRTGEKLSKEMNREKNNIEKDELNIDTLPLATGLAILSRQREVLEKNRAETNTIEELMETLYSKDYQDKFEVRKALKFGGVEYAKLFQQKQDAENAILVIDKCSPFLANPQALKGLKEPFLKYKSDIETMLKQFQKEYPSSDLIVGLDVFTYLQSLSDTEKEAFVRTYNLDRKIINNITENLGERSRYFQASPLQSKQLLRESSSQVASDRTEMLQNVSAKLIGPLIASYKQGLYVKGYSETSYQNSQRDVVSTGKETVAYNKTTPQAFIAVSLFKPATSRFTYATSLHPITTRDIQIEPQEGFELSFDYSDISIDVSTGVCGVKQELRYKNDSLGSKHLFVKKDSPNFLKQYYQKFAEKIYSLRDGSKDYLGLTSHLETAKCVSALIQFQQYRFKSGQNLKAETDFVQYFAGLLETNKITTIEELGTAFDEGKIQPLTISDLIDEEIRSDLDKKYPDTLAVEGIDLPIIYSDSYSVSIYVTPEQAILFYSNDLKPKTNFPTDPKKNVTFRIPNDEYVYGQTWSYFLKNLSEREAKQVINKYRLENGAKFKSTLTDINPYTSEVPEIKPVAVGKSSYSDPEICVYETHAVEDGKVYVICVEKKEDAEALYKQASWFKREVKKQEEYIAIGEYLELLNINPIDLELELEPIKAVALEITSKLGPSYTKTVYIGPRVDYVPNMTVRTLERQAYESMGDAEQGMKSARNSQHILVESLTKSKVDLYVRRYTPKVVKGENIPKVVEITVDINLPERKNVILYEACESENGILQSKLFKTSDDAEKARSKVIQEIEIAEMVDNINSRIPENWQDILKNLKVPQPDKSSFTSAMENIKNKSYGKQDLFGSLKYVLEGWKRMVETTEQINFRQKEAINAIDKFKESNTHLVDKKYPAARVSEEAKQNLIVKQLCTENGQLLAKFYLSQLYGRDSYDVGFSCWEEHSTNNGYWDGESKIGKTNTKEYKVEMSKLQQFEESQLRLNFQKGTGQYSQHFVAKRGNLFYQLQIPKGWVVKTGIEYPVVVVSGSSRSGIIFVELVEEMVNLDGSLKGKKNTNITTLPLAQEPDPFGNQSTGVVLDQLAALKEKFTKTGNNKKKK